MDWIQWTIALAAFVTACGILWSKVLNPLRKVGRKIEEAIPPLLQFSEAAVELKQMIPLLVEFTQTFKDNPKAFETLDEIQAEFSPDSGTSLRDVINELTKSVAAIRQAAAESKEAAEVLAGSVELSRKLADTDRAQLVRLVAALALIDAKVSGGRDAQDRIEVDRANVAAELKEDRADLQADRQRVAEVAEALKVAQALVDGVALDLKASHERADASESSESGHAADAASRSGAKGTQGE